MAELNEMTIREHDRVSGSKRVSLFPSTAQTIIDEAEAPNTTYVGVAPSGAATSSGVWLITKIVVSGATTTITHATDAWDHRATTASYS